MWATAHIVCVRSPLDGNVDLPGHAAASSEAQENFTMQSAEEYVVQVCSGVRCVLVCVCVFVFVFNDAGRN